MEDLYNSFIERLFKKLLRGTPDSSVAKKSSVKVRKNIDSAVPACCMSTESLRFKSQSRNFVRDFCCTCTLNSDTMNTLIILCRWEDETASERTGHPPSYTEA